METKDANAITKRFRSERNVTDAQWRDITEIIALILAGMSEEDRAPAIDYIERRKEEAAKIANRTSRSLWWHIRRSFTDRTEVEIAESTYASCTHILDTIRRGKTDT